MFVPTLFFLKTAHFMLDKKNYRIVERYNTSVIRTHIDKMLTLICSR